MYFRVVFRIGTLALLLAAAFSGLAQETQFSPGFSWRGYDGCDADRLCHYHPTNSFESAFQEFAAWRSANSNPNSAESFMNFRVAFPLNYDVNREQPYPIILMLHGAGESGRIWQGNFNYATSNILFDNNSRNLLHGGNVHQQAANRNPTHPQAFPGIIIFPQASYSGSWSSGYNNGELTTNQEYLYEFLDYMVANYNGDINRIYMHGLSNGARGTWDTATKRPDLFAAILPMSGLPYDLDVAADVLHTTPIRLYQGGTDTNPSPGGALEMIGKLQTLGGTPQYIFYPTLGHGTWNTAYAEADFWSWMLAKDKRNIHVYGGSTDLCAGATKKLGFSAGFTAYRWKKDGVIISGQTTRYLTITGTGNYAGAYTVEFQRPGDLSGTWYSSNPVNIAAPSGGGLTPQLTVQGSLIMPYTRDDGINIGSIGQTETRLFGPAGYQQYEWYRNGIRQTVVGGATSTTTNNVRIALGGGSGGSSSFNGQGNQANAGNWTVRVLEPSGCWSNLSNSLTFIYNAGASGGCYPNCHTNPTGGFITAAGEIFINNISVPTLTALSEKKLKISWTETVPNEEYFEIWRYRRSTLYPNQANFVMVGTAPANSTEFIDETGLRPYAEYQYSIRAVALNDGRFSRKSLTNPAWPRTLDDFQSPTTPTNLVVTNIGETSVSISWNASSDNDVIHRYEVFNGATMVASLTNDLTGDQTDGSPAPPTTYTFTGLEPGTTYLLNVRAKDFRNNYSAFPQAVVATTSGATNGLSYKYYTTSGLSGNNTANANQLAEPYTATNGPNFNFSTATPAQVGTISNFSGGIALAQTIQGTNDPNNFVLAFDGYIQIDVQRNYRFFTSSDDGSRLYINGSLMVNNDGAQGTTNVASNVINLPVGKHAIRVTFFDNTGGNVLGVKYSWDPANPNGTPTDNYNNVNAVFIPDNKLFLTNTTLTQFFSKSTGDLNLTSSWGTNTDGSGSAPSSFTTNYQIFNIANRASATINTAWTVSGTSSRVVVGTNVNLTLNEALTGKVYAGSGSVINLNHTSIPELKLLDPTSTVNMNVEGNIPSAIYGNLSLNSGFTTKTLPLSSTLIMGDMVIDNDVVLNGSSFPDRSTLTVAGDITFNGTSGAPLEEDLRYTILLDGSSPHTINVNQTDIALAGLEVEGTLNLQFNDSNPHTVTVGVANGSGGLLLKSGAILELGNHHLIINGVYGINPTDDSGVINVAGGDITVSTTSGQTSNLYFGSSNTIHDLTLSNSGSGQINLTSTAQLTNLMTVDAGTVNMQGDFTLRSTSDAGNGTARIGPLLNEAQITGNITAERYMSGEGKIYRYISSPVQGASAAQLQSYFPITGNFTGASVLPPPVTSSGASMFSYTEPAYVQFPSVGGSNQETLEVGRGYAAYIREGFASTVWKVTGEPNQGNINFTLTGGSGGETGWNLIGNPYPAPVQWTNGNSGGWTGTGLNGIARIRVNSNGTTQVLTAGAGWDGVVAPGQSFWIQTISGSPTLTVQETAKVVNDGAFYRAAEDDNKILVTMRKGSLTDVIAIRFTDEATTAYDLALDGIKLDNSYFNLSSLTSDNQAMALNNTALNYCEQEVKLRITNAATGNYTLDVTGIANLISQDEVTFTDNFTQTEITISDALTYPFSITTDVASKADGRFALRFKKPEVVLNQTLKTEAACEQSSPVVLVNNSQPGVTYQAFHNGIALSDGFMSTGGTLELPVNPALIGIGSTELNIKAGFTGCNSYDLPMTIAVQRDTLPLPYIIGEPTKLVASTENATYQWYLNGTPAPEQTGREWLNPENGKYVVEVFKGTCFKTSDTLEYVVTGIEKPNRLYQLYPNPTRNKFIITLEEPIDHASMRVISTVGQVMVMPVTKISEYSAEVDLTEVQTGFYLLQVNGQRYKVLKE